MHIGQLNMHCVFYFQFDDNWDVFCQNVNYLWWPQNKQK